MIMETLLATLCALGSWALFFLAIVAYRWLAGGPSTPAMQG